VMRWLFLIIILLASACATKHQVQVGDERVTLIREQRGKGKSFVHLHQNETTALKAARMVIKQQGGSVLTIKHSGQRNVVFHLHKKRYEFDPNRIFTSKGIKKTLEEYSEYTPEAYGQVKKLADEIKLLLPPGKIIAVHNNETYSFKDYWPGHNLEKEARLIYRNNHLYYRNFYLVTQKQDFVRLKNYRFNSVWQTLDATDDGSLSVFLGKSPYINVEAGYDQLSAQIEMLKYA
jgi:hypothetical protein